MLKKESVAVAVALITGLAGVATALVNRFDPSEPAAEASYEVTKKNFDALVDDIDSLETHVDDLEHKILRQCLRRIRTATPIEPSGTNEPTTKPRKRNRRRSKMPSYNTTQQRRQ
jgi:hypothetical protein